MSRKNFTLYFVPLLMAGFAGILLRIYGTGHSTARDVVSIMLLAVAVVGLIVVFRHDLRTTEAEELAEWAEARAKGRRGYVLSRVGGTLPFLLIAPLAIASDGYSRGRPLGEELQAFSYLLWAAPVCVASVTLWSLAWWNRQSKKYAGHF